MLFRRSHQISLGKIDPLGDGLGDMIAAEQREAEAIHLYEDLDGNSLAEQWQHVIDEAKNDPSWFSLANEE